MRNVLGVSALRELREFLETDPLLGFDYDGTLSPIVGQPARAVIRPASRRLLKQLCVRFICVLLSGRARQDVLAKVDGIPFAQVVGSHGADWATPRLGDAVRRKQVAGWDRQLKMRLARFEGVQLENKGLSLSIHVRHARRPAEAKAWIADTLAALPGARVVGGKHVYNLLPSDNAGKGWALLELKRIFDKPAAIYIGDDATDEEVFELPAAARVFKIRVGYSATSKADYYIASQCEVERLLEVLNGRCPSEIAA